MDGADDVGMAPEVFPSPVHVVRLGHVHEASRVGEPKRREGFALNELRHLLRAVRVPADVEPVRGAVGIEVLA